MIVVIKLVSKRLSEDKVEDRIFIGPEEGKLQLAGTVQLSVGEWQTFGALLLLGGDAMNANSPRVQITTEGDDEVVGKVP